MSLGVPAIVRAIFGGVFESWPLYRQILLFGGSFFVILGLLSVVIQSRILASKTNGGKTGGKKVPVQAASATNHTQNLAEQMTQLIHNDSSDPSGCVKVFNRDLDWRHLADIDSYFTIYLDVFSSSVLRIDVGKRIDGHLRYGRDEFERPPEVIAPIRQLHRSHEGRLELRQWVSRSMMDRLALDGGKEITLDFSTLNILVDADWPDGSRSVSGRLRLPNQWQVRIPTRQEVTNS